MGNSLGQEFYERILKKRFKEALEGGVKLKVDLDGVEGYPSSFLSESFGLLGNEFGAELVWNNLVIVSNIVPKYIKKIEGYVFKRGHSFLIALLFSFLDQSRLMWPVNTSFLDIKTETNIIELLLSVGTIVIGVYIAVVLERNRNRSQNFYQYVERKYDALWETFIQFSSVLELSANVELNETSKWFSLIDQKLSPLIKVVESFEYDSNCLTEIEKKIDELEEFLSNNPNIKNYILELSADKEIIIQKLNEINELFAQSFKYLANV
jgi:hypothetical protein